MNYDYKTILGAILIGVAVVMAIYAFVSMAFYAVKKIKDQKII